MTGDHGPNWLVASQEAQAYVRLYDGSQDSQPSAF
jgi:hypothetical protein